jgi:histidine triad (HIT) family protein
MSTDCIFCTIARGELDAVVVYEDEQCVAFEDLNPQAPVHVLVIPKKHLADFGEADAADAQLLGHLCRVCENVAELKGIAADGYRVVANKGALSGQSVFHLHLHVLGGRPMSWPPG